MRRVHRLQVRHVHAQLRQRRIRTIPTTSARRPLALNSPPPRQKHPSYSVCSSSNVSVNTTAPSALEEMFLHQHQPPSVHSPAASLTTHSLFGQPYSVSTVDVKFPSTSPHDVSPWPVQSLQQTPPNYCQSLLGTLQARSDKLAHGGLGLRRFSQGQRLLPGRLCAPLNCAPCTLTWITPACVCAASSATASVAVAITRRALRPSCIAAQFD